MSFIHIYLYILIFFDFSVCILLFLSRSTYLYSFNISTKKILKCGGLTIKGSSISILIKR